QLPASYETKALISFGMLRDGTPFPEGDGVRAIGAAKWCVNWPCGYPMICLINNLLHIVFRYVT
ncbi:MAG: hypothetical protein ABL874_11975, partial [Sphingopyxis sp.]